MMKNKDFFSKSLKFILNQIYYVQVSWTLLFHFISSFPSLYATLRLKKRNALLTGGIYVFHFIINKILIDKNNNHLPGI